MAVQNLGLGLLLEAKDLASGVLQRYGTTLLDVTGKSGKAAESIKTNMRAAGLGLSMFAAGVAGLAILSPAVEAASRFGQGVAEITTLTEEASLSSAFLSQSVLDMNAAYGGGTAGQTKAMYDGISAGASNAAEATALLASSNKLAVAGKTEVGVALDGLTSAMNAYGVSFDNAADYSDALFVAVQKGKTTIPELSAVIGRVAPTAASLKIPFGELNAALAAVTAKGLKTEEAATGIKAALTNIINPTSDATKEAKRLGVEFTAAAVRQKGFAGVLQEVTSSSDFNEDSLSKLFSSVEGLNAVLALTAGGGGKFNDALAAMAAKGGASQKAFEKMAATLAFQEKRFEGLKENATILIGQGLEPLKASVMRVVNAILEGFNKIPAPIRNFLVQAFAVASVLLAVTGGALALKSGLALAGTALRALGVSATGSMASLLPVVGTIALIGLALYGLKLAYDQNLGGFADKVNAVVADVKLGLDALGQLFTDGAFSGDTMFQLNLGKNSGIKEFAIEVFLIANRIKAFFTGIGEGFAASSAVVGTAVGRLTASVQPIVDVFSKLFASDGADASAGKFDRWAAAGRVVGGVLAEIAAITITAISWLGQLVSGAVVGFSRLGPIFEGVGGAFGEIVDVVKSIGMELGITGDAGDGLGQIFFALGIGVAGVFGMLAGLVRGVVAAIAGAIRSIATVVSGVVNIVGGIIDGDWSRVWLGAKQVVFGVVQAVISVIGGLVEGIASAIDAVGAVVGKDLGAAKAVKGFRTQLETDARNFFGVPAPGGTPTSPAAAGQAAQAGAGAAAAAVVQAQQFGPPTAETAAAAASAAVAAQKPPQVTATTIVMIDGENIPATSTTRTSTRGGVPVAAAGV